MTNNIVTRLEEWSAEWDLYWTLPYEAADKIERLRKESHVWEMAARTLAKELGEDVYADEAYQKNCDLVEHPNEVLP